MNTFLQQAGGPADGISSSFKRMSLALCYGLVFLGWNFAVNESLDNLDNSDVIQTRVLRRKSLLPAAFSCPLVGFYDIFSGESKSLYLHGLHKL